MPPSFTQQMTPQQVGQLVQQYYQTAGISKDDSQLWMNYWNQWGNKDPNYFLTKLLNGMQAIGGNMQPFQSLQQQGIFGPGTSGFTDNSQVGSQLGGGGLLQGGGQGGGLGSLAQLQQTPGYQFTQQAAMDAIQNSAAARGTLLTGGTLKALQNNAAGIAAQQTFFPTVGALGNLAQLGANAAAGQ